MPTEGLWLPRRPVPRPPGAWSGALTAEGDAALQANLQRHQEAHTSASRSQIPRGGVPGQFHPSGIIIHLRLHPGELLSWFAGFGGEFFKETAPHLNRILFDIKLYMGRRVKKTNNSDRIRGLL